MEELKKIKEPVLKNNFTLQDYYKLRQEFNAIDQDGDDHIDLKEFLKTYSTLRPEPLLNFHFQSMDQSGDGQISWVEYVAYRHMAQFPSKSDEDIHKFFLGYDKNKDSKVTKEEILDACNQLASADGPDSGGSGPVYDMGYVDSVMNFYDLNGDGGLIYGEFYCFMHGINPRAYQKEEKSS